ncbi:MAG TPA: hypothetical protein VK203_13515 [Nostocaceae cyanobacterium]|nr:hypothetical protein [Nostocaceae cyanobacterium]
MTPNVVEKTAIIPQKSQRRHQDSFWLWIAVFTGSVALHLLAFLLLRSLDGVQPWFPQTNQGAIAIDLIELDSDTKSTAKPLPRASQTSQPVKKSQDDGQQNSNLSLVEKNPTNPTPSTPQPTPTQQAVKASIKPQPTPQTSIQSTPQPQPTPQTNIQSTPQPTPTPQTSIQSTPQPTPTPQTPSGKPWQGSRPDIRYGKGQLLPGDLPENLRNSATSTPGTNQENTPDQQGNKPNSEQSGENTPPPADNNSESDKSGENTPTPPDNPQTGSGLIAGWQFLTPEEQRVKIQKDPPPTDLILPQYIGSKKPEISILGNGNQDLPQGKFLVSLVINQSGKLVAAEFVGSNLPPQDKQKVVSLAKEIFQGEPFEPHRFPDDRTPPELSNLLLWLTIKPNNSP